MASYNQLTTSSQFTQVIGVLLWQLPQTWDDYKRDYPAQDPKSTIAFHFNEFTVTMENFNRLMRSKNKRLPPPTIEYMQVSKTAWQQVCAEACAV
jgi:hypothetical protein